MAFEADAVVDRRLLKRRLWWWRAVALAAVVVLGLVIVDDWFGIDHGDSVAQIDVEGLIVDDPKREALIAAIAKDPSVKALIVRIDSPGGTIVGGESLYRALRAVSETKPVVAAMANLATSGGYMAALAADRIVAREGTVTGSIGVILQTTEVSELLKSIGITTEAIKSGPLKAEPSPFAPMTPEAREAMRTMVADMYEFFLDLVVERRKLARDSARALADGRVFTGRRAVQAGLVDALGGIEEARAWLEAERQVPKKLPLRKLKAQDPVDELFGSVAALARKVTLSERLTLDGLISLWHPELR